MGWLCPAPPPPGDRVSGDAVDGRAGRPLQSTQVWALVPQRGVCFRKAETEDGPREPDELLMEGDSLSRKEASRLWCEQ